MLKESLCCNSRYSITPDSSFHPIELELPYKSCHHSLLKSGPELARNIADFSFSSKVYEATRLAAFVKDLKKSIDTATEPHFSDRKGTQYRFMTKYSISLYKVTKPSSHTTCSFSFNSQNTTCFGCSVQPSSGVTSQESTQNYVYQLCRAT